MQEMSKFQIFTVMFLLMFVFVIGAIYTNTKEAAENKMNNQYTNQEQNAPKIIQTQSTVDNTEIQSISQRVNNIEQQIQNLNNNRETDLKCKIRGVMDDGTFINLSVSDALDEAKINGKELVMTCKY